MGGAHAEVWAEMSDLWASFGEVGGAAGWVRTYTIDRADAAAVVAETFTRVARNVDRVVERLRDTGYRFECEAGRVAAPVPPRRPADQRPLAAWLEAKFGDHPMYDPALPPLPPALAGFAQHVGSVDLRQTIPSFDATDGTYAEDPVVARLGDWDPLEVDLDHLAFDLTDPEATPQIGEGLVWPGEFAASFEHKADVSGAMNPWIAFPQLSLDPIVHAEGHNPQRFTDYLRHAFRHGGFLGVPRAVRMGQVLDRPITDELFLPDHPIFASLAEGLEPF